MSNKVSKSNGGKIALDIAVFILIAAAIAGIVIRIVLDYPSEQTKSDGKAYSAELRIDRIYNTALNSINVGDKIYFTADGEYIGEIVEIEQDLVTDIERDAFPYYTGATVKVKLTYGRITDGSFKIQNGEWLTPNGIVSICTDTVEFEARITGVDEG